MFEDVTLTQALEMVGPLVAVAYILGGIGQGITKAIWPKGFPRSAAGLKGWRFWFRRTYQLHPIVAGALVGLSLPLPTPDFMGGHLWGRVVWFAVAGLSAVPIHSWITVKLEALDDEDVS